MKQCVFVLVLISFLLAEVSRAPKQVPPGDLSVEEVPMFISIGWDDNSHSGMPGSTAEEGGVRWVCDFTKELRNPEGTGQEETFDGAPVRTTFFSNSFYIEPYNGDFSVMVKWAHNYAYRLGHEIANHTHSHLTGGDGPYLSVDAWEEEIYKCSEMFSRPAPAIEDSALTADDPSLGAGVPIEEIVGFRAPYLFYGNNLFTALKNLNFIYDSSIEEGMDPAQDGTNFYWPYTMDHESPGHRYMSEVSGTKEPEYAVPEHPGIWQLPVYALVTPPDDECENYGLAPGFRDRLKEHVTTLGKPGAFDVDNGKISGLDYNMFYFIEFNLTKEEVLATLKYSLDQRMRGNRAPMVIGFHSQYYTPVWNGNAGNIPDDADRRAIVEEFVQYALETYEDVRFVPMRDLQQWLETPVALEGSTPIGREASPRHHRGVQIISQREGLLLSAKDQFDATVRVYTPSGQLVFEEARHIPRDGIHVATPTLRGMYVVRISGGDKTISQRVLFE
ncbi:T9SS type A sorting domain-containing protein [Chitinivibrio alkaliphilus]|uniref:Polysaccharide deacetylase n=1 Tax=Chitinivibrio alkaliphilus ACht1 TaxID=1313304 RepID=U7D8E9_9BACT|nr:T9SS type A sorting domain-containing protein [Chitinivibrio alkaliphilus]ERP39240.1 polysaccharide deacetylase [Chitinivibrio alkaliphilus ACht1]